MSDASVRRRSDTPLKKTVYLTPSGRDQIAAWAAANGVNFSTAIETLALIGLADSRSDYTIPALRDVTRQAIGLAVNRFVELLSDIRDNTSASQVLLEGLLLQTIRAVAVAHPDDFEIRMRVPRDSRRPLDQRIRRLHAEVIAAMTQEAAHRRRRQRALPRSTDASGAASADEAADR